MVKWHFGLYIIVHHLELVIIGNKEKKILAQFFYFFYWIRLLLGLRFGAFWVGGVIFLIYTRSLGLLGLFFLVLFWHLGVFGPLEVYHNHQKNRQFADSVLMINMYFLGSQEITDMKDLFEDQEEFSQKGELFEIIGDQLESADCVVNFFNLDVEPQYFTIQDQSGVLVFICDYVNVFES